MNEDEIWEKEHEFCGDCGIKLTEETRWSDYTCKKCARELNLDEFERIE